MPLTLRPARVRALALALVLSGAVSACGSSDSGSAPSPGGTPAAGGGITVRNAEFNWSAATLTNAVLGEVAERKPELGVKELQNTPLGPAPAWAGAKRGDIDLLTEVALPNQQKFADDAKERISFVSRTYDEATQGFFVPRYMVEPGGVAEGLKSVDQLEQYKDKVGGKLVDGPAGYVTTEYNARRLKAFGLTLEHQKVEEAAGLAQLRRAYARKDPILIFLYHPQATFAQYDLVQLEEPAPNRPGCLEEGGDGKCAHSSYSANIAVSKELREQAPAFVAFLGKFRISIEQMEEMQKAVEVDKKDEKDVARQFVDAHRAEIDGWAATG